MRRLRFAPHVGLVLALLPAIGSLTVSSRPVAQSASPASPAAPPASHDYPVKPVPFTAVHINDSFWAPRIEINRKVTIPFAFQQCEKTDASGTSSRRRRRSRRVRIPNCRAIRSTTPIIYKVIEGASYTLSVKPDPKLDKYVDGLIEKIAAAQEKDGYLYTARTMNPQQPHRWAGTERWELEGVDSHELYNLGHLYEAAVAHYQATGKRSLLDIAVKTANLLGRDVRPRQADDLAGASDHGDGAREAVSHHRRRTVSESGEVHARRARAGSGEKGSVAGLTTSRKQK